MSRVEIYPWSTLTEVGDYFAVTTELRPDAQSFMYATVAQRNSYRRGLMKYACSKTTYGCIVMLVQVGDEVPDHDYSPAPGILARVEGKPATGVPMKPRLPALGNRPPVKELSQSEKVARMTRESKNANLPWWYEGGKLLWNPAVPKRKEDVEAYIGQKFAFGPDDPYPEFYNLDNNLTRIERERTMLEEDDEEDLWAGYSADGQPPEGQEDGDEHED